MNMKKTIFTFLLCSVMILCMTACSSSQGSGNVGKIETDETGNSGTTNVANNATADGASDPSTSAGMPFAPGEGDSLAEFAGVWVLGETLIFITEDGTWGWSELDGSSKEVLGPVMYKNGTLSLASGSDGEWAVLEFVPDGEGNLACSNEGNLLMMPLQNMFPVIETIPDDFVGFWKYEGKEAWISINKDATWSEINSEGKEVSAGRIYKEEERDAIMLLTDSAVLALYSYDSDGYFRGDEENLIRALSLPGSSEISGSYVGLWLYNDVDVCVYINSDGTWMAVNAQNEIFQQGKVSMEAESSTLLLTAKDSSVTSWTLKELGELSGENGKRLEKLDLTADATVPVPQNYLGMLQMDHLNLWITIKEDYTWTAVNKENEVLYQGNVIVREEDGEPVVILNYDDMGFPIVMEGDGTIYVHRPQDVGSWYRAGVDRVEEVPEVFQYIGLYQTEEFCIRFTEGGCFNLYDTDAVWKSDGEFWIDPETNKLTLYMPGSGKVQVESDGNGGWTDSAGVTLAPVDFVPALNERLQLSIQGTWYYEAKDMYLKFRYSDNMTAVWVVDKENHLIAEGTITFGLEAVYTVIVESAELNVTLTLDKAGNLTDEAGNVLVKEYYIPWYNIN